MPAKGGTARCMSKKETPKLRNSLSKRDRDEWRMNATRMTITTRVGLYTRADIAVTGTVSQMRWTKRLHSTMSCSMSTQEFLFSAVKRHRVSHPEYCHIYMIHTICSVGRTRRDISDRHINMERGLCTGMLITNDVLRRVVEQTPEDRVVVEQEEGRALFLSSLKSILALFHRCTQPDSCRGKTQFLSRIQCCIRLGRL